jgi:hypothetical protein
VLEKRSTRCATGCATACCGGSGPCLRRWRGAPGGELALGVPQEPLGGALGAAAVRVGGRWCCRPAVGPCGAGGVVMLPSIGADPPSIRRDPPSIRRGSSPRSGADAPAGSTEACGKTCGKPRRQPVEKPVENLGGGKCDGLLRGSSRWRNGCSMVRGRRGRPHFSPIPNTSHDHHHRHAS